MPTARQPFSLASCTTTEPTAPDAALTTTVSPGFGSPILARPAYAVRPGMPSTPSAVDSGATDGSSRCTALRLTRACSCQPHCPTTNCPAVRLGSFDATTSPTVPPTITSPTATGLAYDLASLIRPRMYGSSDR